jgi:LPS O-antigen subunit length determinant protein (WzzB/FepE family)
MAKRDEYDRNMQQKLDELDAKYKELVKRAVEAKADAKKVLDEKVKVAKAKRDVAAQKLAELKEAGHDRWEKVKESVGSAIDDLKKIFE